MKLKGNVIRFGDNIDTDVIIPARYLNTSDPEELARHCMEDLDDDFSKRIKPGDILVAGSNFGCGSSREHAPLAIKYAGISCVVAKSFARIFYRNAINIGLPILTSNAQIDTGDKLTIDLTAGKIINHTNNRTTAFEAFPEFLQSIINAGGLMNAMKEAAQHDI